MNFAGRWVLMEVMNAIFVLWGIAVVCVFAVAYWVRRKRPPEKPMPPATRGARRRKRRSAKYG